MILGRYLGRPVIATSRIDNYDGDMVTFHYNRHEDEKYVQRNGSRGWISSNVSSATFKKHFKMIRYGGLVMRRHRQLGLKILPGNTPL